MSQEAELCALIRRVYMMYGPLINSFHMTEIHIMVPFENTENLEDSEDQKPIVATIHSLNSFGSFIDLILYYPIGPKDFISIEFLGNDWTIVDNPVKTEPVWKYTCAKGRYDLARHGTEPPVCGIAWIIDKEWTGFDFINSLTTTCVKNRPSFEEFITFMRQLAKSTEFVISDTKHKYY